MGIRNRKPLVFFALAIILAIAISAFSKSTPYHERLIDIQAEQELGRIDAGILQEATDIKATLLDYAADEELLLKSWLALRKYPEAAREALRLYGGEANFKDVLRQYGDIVIPVIQYFLDHEVLSVRIMAGIQSGVDEVKDQAAAAWKKLHGGEQAAENATKPAAPAAPVSRVERGWYAIDFIRSEGHRFIAQFSIDETKHAKWNQTSRLVTGLSSFLTGGIENLERKYDLDQEIKAGDAFFATLDLVPMIAAVKLLKAGGAVSVAGKELGVVSRTRIFAGKLIPRSPLFRALGKYAAIAATAYVIVRHPSLVSSLLEELAGLAGLDPRLVKFAGWTALIFIALYPFSWLLVILMKLLSIALSLLEKPAQRSVVRRSA